MDFLFSSASSSCVLSYLRPYFCVVLQTVKTLMALCITYIHLIYYF